MDITLILVPQLIIISLSVYMILELVKQIPFVKKCKYKVQILTIISILIGSVFGFTSGNNLPDFVKESIVLSGAFGAIAGYLSTVVYNLTVKPLKDKIKSNEKEIREVKNSLPPPKDE